MYALYFGKHLFMSLRSKPPESIFH